MLKWFSGVSAFGGRIGFEEKKLFIKGFVDLVIQLA
jgi:hypothetical protein